ncbi:MAG: hypothetical protein KDC38_01495 [Planctomycetes bacterium]|nr:hypothetical protein [Planctomycetota bacterium]
MKWLRVIGMGALLLAAGCGESVQAIHNAADAMTGNQAVREGDRLQGQVQELQRAHEQRLQEALGR